MVGIERAPPPFFRRGPAPFVLLVFYLALSSSLFIVDLRFRSVDLIRQALSVMVQPLQQLAQKPVLFLVDNQRYFSEIDALRQENLRLKHVHLQNAPSLLRIDSISSENDRLRRLLSVKEKERVEGQVAQILHAARDPFSQRIVVDKGLQSGVVSGQSVVDEAGVIGQVTRVSAFSSEITLITDKEQAIPVQVLRNGLRSVLFGLGEGELELRYLPLGADIREDDVLITSGLDSIYLPGFPVAKIKSVDHDPTYPFTRVFAVPLAAVENFGEVLLLNLRLPLSPPTPEIQSPARQSMGRRQIRNKVEKN